MAKKKENISGLIYSTEVNIQNILRNVKRYMRQNGIKNIKIEARTIDAKDKEGRPIQIDIDFRQTDEM